MDAHALLTSQGWRGSGHSLHASSDSIGLSRPLLVSKKQNTLGVGKKQHRTSDMWWMNAFDKSLKGLDTTEEGKVVQTINNGGLDMVKKGGSKFVGTGGLYANFVRGQGLNGTLTPEDIEEKTPVENIAALPNKRRIAGETKEERRARKAAKRAARDEGNATSNLAAMTPILEKANAAVGENIKEETKEERRERRRLKKLARLQQAPTESVIPRKSGKSKKG